ncbi:hypothetical protein [Streptomyces axinellae]|uniref:Transposase n=1 Tax=Streptomyces axinellae TaxID=552788 RepID=A0ABP6DDY9_9ACTN
MLEEYIHPRGRHRVNGHTVNTGGSSVRAHTGPRPPKDIHAVDTAVQGELANLAGDHLADVADATGQGIHRINANPRLPWSFLAHTGLTIHPPHPPNLRKGRSVMRRKS